MLRATAALVFLCLSSPAHSHQFNCDAVRAYVAEHGRAKALAYAIRHGATFQQIKEARKCLSRQVQSS